MSAINFQIEPATIAGGVNDARIQTGRHLSGSAGRYRNRTLAKAFADFPLATTHAGINKSLLLMLRRFHTPIRVNDLITVSGLSRRGFAKAFNQHVGANAKFLLSQLRIERAKQLLATHDLPSIEIARECGYESANTFWVAFRRATGKSPTAFRNHN